MALGAGTLRAAAADERGAVLVIVAVAMTAILVTASLAIDTSIWFVHRRHLQTQADAAALAGGQKFQLPDGGNNANCGPINTAIDNAVHQYDGSNSPTPNNPNNPQVQVQPNMAVANPPLALYNQNTHDLFSEINRPDFFNQTNKPGDTGLSGSDTADGSPCADKQVDVKLTETNLPSFFSIIKPGYVNAQARVTIEQESGVAQASAFAELLGPPTTATATVVNEDSGGGGISLSNCDGVAGPCSGLTLTSTPANPFQFSGTATLPASVPAALLGAEVTFGGSGATTTYADYSNGGSAPPYGLAYARVWPAVQSVSAAPKAPPQVADMWLTPTSGGANACNTNSAPQSPSNFVSSSSSSNVYLCANVTFNTLSGASLSCSSNKASLSATKGGGALNMNCPTGGSDNGVWQSDAVSLGANGGATMFKLTSWTLKAGAKPTGAASGHDPCGNGNNACTGNFSNVEQQAFMGAYDQATSQSSHSGPVSGVAIADGNGEVTSIAQSSANSDHITITVNYMQPVDQTSISGSPAQLSFGSNKQNQAIGCLGQGDSQVVAEIANGCPGPYQVINPSTQSCSNQPQTYCVGPTSTGNKLIQHLSEGMNDRIYCGGYAASGAMATCDTNVNKNNAACPGSFNYWDAQDSPTNALSDVLSQGPPDPRLITLFISGFGDEANGNHYMPIQAFADFYVTGWANDPCLSPSNGGKGGSGTNSSSNPPNLKYVPDDAASSGVLMGHFVKVVDNLPGGSGSGTCSASAFGNCIPILTK